MVLILAPSTTKLQFHAEVHATPNPHFLWTLHIFNLIRLSAKGSVVGRETTTDNAIRLNMGRSPESCLSEHNYSLTLMSTQS